MRHAGGSMTGNDRVDVTRGLQELERNVSTLIESGELTSVGVGASDYSGIFRGKNLPASVFVERIHTPMNIADMFFALDPADGVAVSGPDHGWWPISDRGFREMRCVTVPDSFRLVPWRPGSGVVLCDFAFNDGTAVSAAPRQVLKRVIERASGMGLVPKVGYELEFIVFRETEQSLEAKSYRGLQPLPAHNQVWGMV